VKVFSNNEWSPLKSVILGRFFEEFSFNVDISFKYFFKESLAYLPNSNRIKVKKQYIEELNEDLEEFKKALEKFNVKIYRPKTISKLHLFSTPNFKTELMPPLNVRDQTLILGNTIIETSVMQRSRYFENDLLKDIFYEAFLDEAKWVKMPSPTLQNKTFDVEYLNKKTKTSKEFFELKDELKNNSTIVDKNMNFNNNLKHFEMMIDAAQFVRFGKDVIVNVSNRNHYLGYLWFKRTFPEYNFHLVTHWVDNHLDSFIVPLNEGTLLLRNSAYKDILPDFLKEWKIIYCPKPSENQFPVYDKDDPILTSLYIDMNILSLDGTNIICNSLFPELGELLYKEGFNPVLVRHRHRRIFAGGFHCFTLDLQRSERLSSNKKSISFSK